MIPTYAPVVPILKSKQGRQEISDCFDCERSAFGSNSRSQRVVYDAKSNQMQTIQTIVAAQNACRRMHKEYGRVTIKKMYKLGNGPRSVVRVLVDGANSSFCMGKQRHHTGTGACRASFTIERINKKVCMYQECFSPECQVGKKRYCSNAREIPSRLAAQLGFCVDPDSDEDAKLNRWAAELFKQMRS